MSTAFVHRVLAVVLSLLCLGSSEVHFARGDASIFSYGSEYTGELLIRQSNPSADALEAGCLYSCDVEACGDYCAPAKRSENAAFVPFNDRKHKLWNETTGEWSRVSAAEYNATIPYRRDRLSKRFDYNVRWNQVKTSQYLVQQLNLDPNGDVIDGDPQFPDNLGFFNGGTNQGTRSQQAAFGTQPFQFGTGGLHGCTMIAVISKRGVYMAHFWERYTTNLNDNVAEGSADLERWNYTVIYPISGETPKDPQAAGDAINWDLFNDDDDNTMLYTMTPLPHGMNAPPAGQPVPLLYMNKIGLIEDLFTRNIPGIGIARKAYRRLNYSAVGGVLTGPDANLVDKSERGQCLFQYDGQGNFRLFYEERVYLGSIN